MTPRLLFWAPFLAPAALALAWLLRRFPRIGWIPLIAAALDRWILGTLLVRGLGLAASLAGEFFRLFQGGNLRGTLFFLILGAAWLLDLFLL